MAQLLKMRTASYIYGPEIDGVNIRSPELVLFSPEITLGCLLLRFQNRAFNSSD